MYVCDPNQNDLAPWQCQWINTSSFGVTKTKNVIKVADITVLAAAPMLHRTLFIVRAAGKPEESVVESFPTNYN